MSLSADEQARLRKHYRDKIADSQALKDYAALQHRAAVVRDFDSSNYGKGGTFSIAGVSASSSVVAIGATGVSVSAYGALFDNKIWWFCPNGVQWYVNITHSDLGDVGAAAALKQMVSPVVDFCQGVKTIASAVKTKIESLRTQAEEHVEA